MSVPGEQLDPPGDLDLRQHLAVLRRRWLLIAVTMLVFVAAVIGWTIRQTPVYEARAQVLVRPQTLDNLLDSSLSLQARDAQRALETELVLARSTSVSERAEDDAGRPVDISVSGSADADVITFSARATDPERAAADATGYAQAYVTERDDARRAELLAAQAEVQAKAAELQGRMAALDREVSDLDALIAITPEADRGPLETQIDELETSQDAERQATESQLLFYQGELDRLQVATDLTRQSGARLIQEGRPPGAPSSPKPTRDAAVAVALGLVVGIGLAFLRDHFDDSVRSTEDVKLATGGLPVLSTIPTVAGWKADDDPCLVTVESPSSPAAEAYRKLRTDVQFLTIGEPIRQLVVTSARPGDGKTTTVANLGVMFARAGKRVIVAACDLRRPRVHTFLGVPNHVGFTSVLLGDAELIDALQPVPNEENLVVLTSGPEAPNPSELLGSAPAQEILARLAAQCDLLIIDCPPVLPVSDALVLARQSDSTLLVCRSGVTRRGDLARTVEQLKQVSASIAGVVLNAVDEAGHESGYRYSYGYTDKPSRRKRDRPEVEAAAAAATVVTASRR
jgi:non-specific protein-tyrosine kinase